jgi:EAL domain-containing protein (putative c-di-GMP-specific phosphodiesterase class I)
VTPPSPPERDYDRLRAEWERYRGSVLDGSTDLPTLAAVLDDVRRLVEERGTIGVIYLDVGGEAIDEPRRGAEAYDAVVSRFAAALRALKGEGLIGTRDIVATLGLRSDKFALFVRGHENLPIETSSLDARARRIRERLERALAEPEGADAHPAILLHEGHALMYRDPMLRAERAIHRALDEAMFMSLRARTREEDRRMLALDEVIAGDQIITLYQPIVDLRTREVLGHEVFSRGPAGGPFEEAERLFALAERTGRLVDLERICRRRALASAGRHLKPGTKLFLNTSAGALQDEEVAGAEFVRLVEAQGLRNEDVVLEVTERLAPEERRPNQQVLRDLKNRGFGVAIDDMGAGYSSLQALVEVEPDYLKFDIALVRNIDRNLIKRSLLETLVDLAEKIGAQVIAEGIEAETELSVLLDLGVVLGQGRFFNAPELVPVEEEA